MTTELLTERLLLREFRESDWRAVHAMTKDEQVTRYIPVDTPSEEGTREAIQVQMESADGGEEPTDPNAWMKAVKESQQQRIDDKVERLAPVLDEQQLSQYRSHLEAKSTGLFGGMMMDVQEVE